MMGKRQTYKPLDPALIRNLVERYRMADDETKRWGRLWYAVAHDFCTSWARKTGRDIETVAGIVAALSPRCHWSRNLRLAEACLSTGTANGGLGRSCRNADAIMAGAAIMDVLKGHKTRAFWADIRHAGQLPGNATIDVWSLRALLGDRAARAPQPARYAWYVRHYAMAARLINALYGETLTAAQLQAITWIVERGRVF